MTEEEKKFRSSLKDPHLWRGLSSSPGVRWRRPGTRPSASGEDGPEETGGRVKGKALGFGGCGERLFEDGTTTLFCSSFSPCLF